jgi:hypothetical protein
LLVLVCPNRKLLVLVEDVFMSAPTFEGMREGWIFKLGRDGLGYYRDLHEWVRVPGKSGGAAWRSKKDVQAEQEEQQQQQQQ